MAADQSNPFDATVELLSRLQEDPDVLFLAMSPPFTVRFEVEQSSINKELSDLDLSEEDFRKQARIIGGMLLAILSHEEDEYVDHMVKEHEVAGAIDEERRGALRDQLGSVRQSFVTDHVKKRFEVKRHSKAPSFASVDWDVKLKIADANLPDWDRFPYATVRLTYQREFDDTPYSFLGQPFDALQVNFSVDEVAHLIRVLLQIQGTLESAEKEV